MRLHAIRLAAFAALILLAALAPAACGIKGDPELPPGQSDDFPRKYPGSDGT
jgi:predicted small lipoprotein YifL